LDLEDIVLSEKQEHIKNKAVEWYLEYRRGENDLDDDIFFPIAGYAGTGKSTIIPFIVKEIQDSLDERLDIRYIAYTGKAALVMNNKGLSATTLHKLIKIPDTVWNEGLGKQELIFRNRNEAERRELNKQVDLAVIDEGSMVPRGMVKDLRRDYGGIKFLVLGDPQQLPPVTGNRNKLFKDLPEDMVLDKIHRQVAGNPILKLSKRVREGKPIERVMSDKLKIMSDTEYKKYMNRFKRDGKGIFIKGDKPRFDQIIVRYNSTRQEINKLIRKSLGYTKTSIAAGKTLFLPEKGEKVLCFQNNDRVIGESSSGDKFPLVNGMVGTCTSDARDIVVRRESDEGKNNGIITFRMDVEADMGEGVEYNNLLVRQCLFEEYDNSKIDGRLQYDGERVNYFDYGYSLTSHKCVSGDTWVWTSSGMEKIKDIVPDNIEVGQQVKFKNSIWSQYGELETSYAFYSGREKTYKIKTRAGLELECSKRHPIQIMNNDGEKEWIKAPNLKEGMRIPIPVGLNAGNKGYIKTRNIDWSIGRTDANIPEIIDENMAELFGALVADGGYNDEIDYGVRMHKHDKKYLDLLQNTAENLFDVNITRQKTRFYFYNKKVRTFMANCGLGYSTAPDKKIPDVILKSPLSVQKAFLRGLFSGDGSMSKKNSNVIRYKTASRDMAEQIQLLLLNIGIFSKRDYVEFENGNHNDSWTISIYSENIDRYRNLIGFIIEDKKRRLSEHSSGIRKMWGDIPGGSKYSNDLRDELRLKGGRNYPEARDIGRLLSKLINGRVRLYKRHITKILESVDNEYLDAIKWFKNRLYEDIFYDEIVFIERGESELYDLTVPERHEFITNGIISHNSQGSEWNNVLVKNEIIPFHKWIYYNWSDKSFKYGLFSHSSYEDALKWAWNKYKHESKSWLYTAVTRAEDSLVLATNFKKAYGYGLGRGKRTLRKYYSKRKF
jgi:exodeoxyribonuclease-5